MESVAEKSALGEREKIKIIVQVDLTE